ncbi:MAG: AAA family ATPase [Cellulosilyticaceae bacterium]
MKDTIFVNLIGGPGIGKSRMAASLFSLCKEAGMNVELIREWVKDYVYENNQCILTDELKIFAEQNHLQHRLKGKVDVVITDAPLMLKLYYQPKEYNFVPIVVDVINQYHNMNFLLTRKGEYRTNGREQTEDEAIVIDNQLTELLHQHKIPFYTVEGSPSKAEEILQYIQLALSSNSK